MRSNFSYSFRRWYGKTLSPLQRSIIERLERQRYYHPKRQVRAFVADDGTHGDSITRILTAYILWHKEKVSPALDAALYVRSKRAFKATHSSLLIPNSSLKSTRGRYSGRGCTYGLVLAIDCHKIHGKQDFDDLRATLQPMVGSTRGSVLIYVGSPKCRWKHHSFDRLIVRPPKFAWAYYSPPPRWISILPCLDMPVACLNTQEPAQKQARMRQTCRDMPVACLNAQGPAQEPARKSSYRLTCQRHVPTGPAHSSLPTKTLA